MIGAALTFAVVEIASGLMPSYLTFALMTPLLGLSALTMITAANAFMQLHTDEGMRGRVMALYMMIFIGGTPLGRAADRLDRRGVRRPLDAHPRGPGHGARGGRRQPVVRARPRRFDRPWATE